MARHAGWIAGYISALGTMYFLILAEGESETAVRTLNADQSLCRRSVSPPAVCLVCVWLARATEFADKAPEKPCEAAKDIWQNSHARLLLIVIFIENLGGAAITILTLYTAQYVMNAPEMAPFFILFIWFSPSPDAFMDATGQALRQKAALARLHVDHGLCLWLYDYVGAGHGNTLAGVGPVLPVRPAHAAAQ